jgi:prefoldin subunit 4
VHWNAYSVDYSPLVVVCFQVDAKLEALKEVNSQELESLQEEKAEVLAKMAAFKKTLYGKFGDSINLEED